MLNSTNRNPNSAALFAFKPRQVLLAEQRTKPITMSKKQNKTQTLTPAQKTLLLHSSIKYLENSVSSKTLKRILNDAQIENEEWKAVSLDLEDMYCKYLDSRNHDETIASTVKKEEIQAEFTTKDNGKSECAVVEDLTKKKKKKKIESEKVVAVDQSKVIDSKIVVATKNSEELLEVHVLSEPAKTKGKKSKKGSDNSDENKPIQSLETREQVENTVSQDNGKLNDNTKDKKKKKSKPNNVDQEQIESGKVVVEEQSENLVSAAGGRKEEKGSKKRKRAISEEDENQPDNNEAIQKSKVKKSKGSEKTKKEKPAVIDGCEKIEKENKLVDNIESTKMSKKALADDENEELGQTVKMQLDHANGNLEKSGEKSYKNSAKKQRSTEPKTVNAFQRVKVDAVEFADEKLQDNSYWAKDGADIGYGAKAQEVLGQVRGRDFRHEKTKKKRGSYRGGLIDLQSHSVKFNYSDEE